ncbi:hypothetical protein, partial [Salmonella enterica]|uniref:hypothetical protein n=1 Tax=Salmonella enterica TaxID=28901 RepID=UPI0014824B95
NKPLADVAQEHINDESLDDEEISDSLMQHGNLSEQSIEKLESIINKTAFDSNEQVRRKQAQIKELMAELVEREQELQAINKAAL